MKREIKTLFSRAGAATGDVEPMADGGEPTDPPRHHHNRLRWSRPPKRPLDTPLAPASSLAPTLDDERSSRSATRADPVPAGASTAREEQGPGAVDHVHGHHGHGHHGHEHDHGHAGHDHGHDHAHGPVARVARHRPPFSLVRLSLVGRLAIALTLSGVVWAAVLWALLPIGR